MSDRTLPLNIQLVHPPFGWAFCLQHGKGSKAERLDYIEVTENAKHPLQFELVITVRPAKHKPDPDFFGPFVQGNPGNRFFYLCVGRIVEAGDPEWSGRVKVPLTGIDWAKIDAATTSGHSLAAKYEAARPDGRPMLASVKLLEDGWQVRGS